MQILLILYFCLVVYSCNLGDICELTTWLEFSVSVSFFNHTINLMEEIKVEANSDYLDDYINSKNQSWSN